MGFLLVWAWTLLPGPIPASWSYPFTGVCRLGPGLGQALPLASCFLMRQQWSQEETPVLVIFTELWTQLLGGQPLENIL